MSIGHDWAHRQPAFPVSPANIGGAHEILTDYVSLHNHAAAAVASAHIRQSRQLQPHNSAKRLSTNRAARKHTTDLTPAAHMANMHHLTRRIESLYTLTERQKNPYDASVFPSMQRRTPHFAGARAGLHEALVEPWLQGAGYSTILQTGRPVTAPEIGAHRRPRRVPDHYQGWSVSHNLRDTFPADDFPLTRRFNPEPEALQYDIYHKALMGEIVAHRMYKEADLRQLFKRYMGLAPLHEKRMLERVIMDLKAELHVA